MHIRSSFDPGGTEYSILNLFNTRQGFFKIYLVLLRDGSLIDRLDEGSGNALYMWFRKRFLDHRVLAKMYKLQRQERIEIIHVHQFIELVYALCLKIMNPRLRIIDHKHLLYDARGVRFYAERMLSQLFTTIITVSQTTKEELIQTFGYTRAGIKVLYNGLKFHRHLSKDEAVSELRRLDLPFDSQRFNVVMVANFVWGKDHETILKAYKTFIRNQMRNVSFYFIGRESDLSQQLRYTYLTESDLESGRIVFCGSIPNASELLPAFDLVVMSSFSETYNNAVVEAAAAGKVLLISDIPIFQELSQNGRFFHLFKTGDPKDFYQKLRVLIACLPSVSTEEQAKYFGENFTFEDHIENMTQIYLDAKIR